MMKKSFSIFALLISLILAIYLFAVKPQITEHNVEEKISWEKEIQIKGPKEAWEEFKKTQKDLGSAKKHENAHLFGSILYKTIGIGGVGICDDSFNYACYHSLLGDAIMDNGTSIVDYANKYCMRLGGWSTIACQHGIGHGAIGATDYNIDMLREALIVCNSIDKNKSLFGCSNGVFMEYNFRTLHSGKRSYREIDPDNLMFPCNKLPKEFGEACYFAQPQWWITMFRQESEKKYESVGKLCLKLKVLTRKWSGGTANLKTER